MVNRRELFGLSAAALLNVALPSLRAESRAEVHKSTEWAQLPVRGVLLSVPDPDVVSEFCDFIRNVFPKEHVNMLALRIEYQYLFRSHPELAGTNAISEEALRHIVQACREAKVKLIPTMNLMAHQSDQDTIFPLLAKYPHLDESPDYNPPHPWKVGGQFDFYTKSLCPLHHDLHSIIFALMDELIEVTGADTFHVGLDEVWIISYPRCPRCGGRDPSEVFAQHATALHNHLESRGCRMWMWSDRLLDGKTTNLLAWQASMNDTYRAIDMIPKDIMICDWKYEDAPPTPAYFAVKGFDVLPSTCYKPQVALAQLQQVYAARQNVSCAEYSSTLSLRMQGVLHTSWISAKDFMAAYRGQGTDSAKANADTFRVLFARIREMEEPDSY